MILGQGAEAQAFQLPEHGFLLDAVDLRFGQGRAHVGELGDDRALVLVEEEELLLFAVPLEVALLRTEVLAELGDLLAQELRGLLGGLIARLDRIADELLDEGVDDVRCQDRMPGGVADVDEPGLLDGRDAQAAEDRESVGRIGARLVLGLVAAAGGPLRSEEPAQGDDVLDPRERVRPGLRRRLEFGPGREVHLLGHALGQRPACEELELGVEIGPQEIGPVIAPRAQDVLDVEHARAGILDHDGRRGPIEARRGEREDRDEDQEDRREGNEDVLPFQDDTDVLLKVDLFSLEGRVHGRVP